MKRVLPWLFLTGLGCALVLGCGEEREAAGPGGPVAVSSTAAQGGSGGTPMPQGGAPQGGGGGANPCDMMQDDGCYTCCARAHPEGEAALRSAFMTCGCPVCVDALTGLPCGRSVCGGGGDPDYPCSACVKSAIGPTGPCFADAGFQSACTRNADCAAFLECFNACAP